MNIIAIDCETTSLHPGSRPVEVAGVRCSTEGEIIDIFESLINPECPIQPDAVEVHGISPEAVAGAPTADAVLSAFFEWMGDDRRLLAHYAPFDIGILSWNAARCGVPVPDDLTVIDTCEIAKGLKETRNNKLETLIDSYDLKLYGQPHRALCDARAAIDYYFSVKDRVGGYSPRAWGDLVQYHYTDEFPEVLADLPDLVRDARPIVISYEDKNGGATERTITPWGWALQSGALNIHGFCHLRKERRQFRADRIVSRLPEVA